MAASSKSGVQDRRGFDLPIYVCMGFIGLSILVFVAFHSWMWGIVLLLIGCTGVITLEQVSAPPANSPVEYQRFLQYGGKNRRRPVLACVGDGLVHGNVSASITPAIPTAVCKIMGMELPNANSTFADPIWVVNCGQNGITTEVVLNERLSRVMACYPDFIMLMIGTVDICAMSSSAWCQSIVSMNQLNEKPTMDVFQRNLTKIVDFIQQASPMTHVGVATLPPIGEGSVKQKAKDGPNFLIQQANEIIAQVVSAQGDRCSVIDVYSRFEALLDKKGGSGGLNLGSSPTSSFLISSVLNPWYHVFPVLSWNFLSKFLGHEVLTDGIHLNERGRDLVVDAIVDWLKRSNLAKAIAVKSC
jgi:lysophospholipase L1-like esterase